MKVFVQIVNTLNGISQTGMIEEPVQKGFEVANALEHFGVNINTIEWIYEYSKNNFRTKMGEIRDTTKIVNIVVMPQVVSDQPSGRKFLGDISNSKSIGDCYLLVNKISSRVKGMTGKMYKYLIGDYLQFSI